MVERNILKNSQEDRWNDRKKHKRHHTHEQPARARHTTVIVNPKPQLGWPENQNASVGKALAWMPDQVHQLVQGDIQAQCHQNHPQLRLRMGPGIVSVGGMAKLERT